MGIIATPLVNGLSNILFATSIPTTSTATLTSSPTVISAATSTKTPIPVTATQSTIELLGRIIFVSDAQGTDSLYSLDLPSQNIDRLTNNVGHDWWPAWCGSNYIVFERGNNNATNRVDQDIVLLEGLENLRMFSSKFPSGDEPGSPACSADGRYLAYSSKNEEEKYVVGWTEIDLTSATLLNRFVPFNDGYPTGGNVSWSPDNRFVIFMSNKDEGFDIYKMDNSNGNATNLTAEFEGGSKYPVLSPDGASFAFACVSEQKEWSLCVSPVQNPSQEHLVRNTHLGSEFEAQGARHAVTPSWSPDGEWIAYASDKDGDWDVYAYRVSDGQEINLTDAWDSDEFHPAWGN